MRRVNRHKDNGVEFLTEMVKGFCSFQETVEMMIDNIDHCKNNEVIQTYIEQKSAEILKLVRKFEDGMQ